MAQRAEQEREEAKQEAQQETTDTQSHTTDSSLTLPTSKVIHDQVITTSQQPTHLLLQFIAQILVSSLHALYLHWTLDIPAVYSQQRRTQQINNNKAIHPTIEANLQTTKEKRSQSQHTATS